MKLSTSSTEATRGPAAAPAGRFVSWVDELVIRITDRAPSTRVLVSILGVSLSVFVFLALTGGKPKGTMATPIGDSAPIASTGADAIAAPGAAPLLTGGRHEATVAASRSRSDMEIKLAPATSPLAASAIAAPQIVRADAPPRVVADAPPRVIDMVRSEPAPAPVAAEIVRAEPLPPRVADAPRVETAVGSTSRAVIESTLSSGMPRPREVSESVRNEPSPALEVRPAAERTPAAETGGGPGL